MKTNTIDRDFPILKQPIHGKRLAYLDNAATTQKPLCVLDALNNYYTSSNANIHRGVHYLSEKATAQYENAREIVQRFINAPSAAECIFVRGTTDAINLVANSFGETFITAGDEILISAMEHHSNIVPWQMLCQRKKALLKIIPITLQGELDLQSIPGLLNPNVKLLAITHASNALGSLNPIKEIIQLAHQQNIPVLVDGAQSAPHLKIDVQDLDCDFFTFSGHKIYGPTGIGVLYGKKRWLDQMSPYQGGGDMILKVSFTETTYNEIPYKFEAGTPAIAAAIGLGAAVQYLNNLGFSEIMTLEQKLLQTATEALAELRGIRIIGTAKEKVGVISFTLQGVHPHDIGSIVDQYGIALRTGHHCAMPIMDFFKIPATVRISFGIYNNETDIVQLMAALHEVKRIFKMG
jgi:cysteine desulfurase/selenocysteine lyase